MKAIINSLKRTHWFKASMALITCLLFLILPSCQKDELNQDPMLNLDNISTSASSNKAKLTGKIKDVDGNWYKTIKIGNQWWMAENLRTTRYNDRTAIPLETDGGNCGTEIPPDGLAWSFLTTPAYCWYDNVITNKNIYGALYNWFVVDPTNPKNVCPTGWHVPTDAEWSILTSVLGGETVAGGKMKQTGTIEGVDGLWYGPNTDASNLSGFSALPSGARDMCGPFTHMGEYGFWWSSSESSSLYCYCRYVTYFSGGVTRGANEKIVGFSIRCLKD